MAKRDPLKRWPRSGPDMYPADVAGLWGVTPRYVNKISHDGAFDPNRLNGERYGANGRYWKFPASEVRRYSTLCGYNLPR